jgi:hypothetical protein
MGDVIAYVRERLVQVRVGLLVALLWGCGWVAAPTLDPVDLAGRFVFIAFLVFQLRLWDDLEDLPSDRLHHKDRILSGLTGLRPVWLTLETAILLTLGLVAVLGGIVRLALYVALLACLLLVYRGRWRLLANRAFRAQLVLLKYPVLLLLSTPTLGSVRGLGASLFTYALLSWHDWYDDYRLRRMEQR